MSEVNKKNKMAVSSEASNAGTLGERLLEIFACLLEVARGLCWQAEAARREP